MIHFISDLHLSEQSPDTAEAFQRYLAGPGLDCETLWILGDLFEYWAGDDELVEPFNARIAAAMQAFVASGRAINIIVGNRDFLLAQAFCQHVGARLHNEPLSLQLGKQSALLMHGDTLCTDDVAYQQFRQMVRSPAWQSSFLAQPLAARQAIAQGARQQSEQAKQDKSMQIMDVNAQAVEETFRTHGCDILIHGHTHRCATHALEVDGKSCVRYVLADWHGLAQWLACDAQGQLRFHTEPAAR